MRGKAKITIGKDLVVVGFGCILLLCLPAFGCSAVEQISPGGSEAISCRLQTFEALPETGKLKEDIAAHIFLLYYLKNVE